jgi:DNA-binding PadR family transcriptional regulator
MRTSSSVGFDIWDAMEGLRDAFAARSALHSSHGSPSGDVRAAILSALAQEPQNGRQVMVTIAARSGGAWSPSASEVYPTLQQLTDEGLLSTRHDEERTVYELTDAGRAVAAEAAASGESLYDSHHWRSSAAVVPKAGAKLAQAAAQVVQSGTREQQERAAAILDETRRKLYAILAED